MTSIAARIGAEWDDLSVPADPLTRDPNAVQALVAAGCFSARSFGTRITVVAVAL